MEKYLNRLPGWVLLLHQRIVSSKIGYRMARGAVWSMAGGIGARMITIASTVIVARLLGPKGNGEFAIIQSALGFLGVFSGFGLGTAATKYLSEFRKKDPDRASRIFSMTLYTAIISGIVFSISCAVFSSAIAEHVVKRAELSDLLRIGALFLFTSTLGGLLAASLSGFEAFALIAKITILNGILSATTAIPLVWIWHVKGAVFSLIISSSVVLILYCYGIRRQFRKYKIGILVERSIWQEWRVLTNFALPAMISGSLIVPVNFIANLILINQANGYDELGVFSAANQWRLAVVNIMVMLNSALLPIFSETQGRENKDDFINAFSFNFKLTLVIALPLTILLLALSRPLSLLYGQQYTGLIDVFPILFLVVFLVTIGLPLGLSIVSQGKMWAFTVLNLVWGTLVLSLSWVLCPIHGSVGLAWAYLIAYAIHSVIKMTYINLKIVPKAIKKEWRLILFSLTILLCCMIFQGLEKYLTVMYGVIFVISTVPFIKFAKDSILQVPSKRV